MIALGFSFMEMKSSNTKIDIEINSTIETDKDLENLFNALILAIGEKQILNMLEEASSKNYDRRMSKV